MVLLKPFVLLIVFGTVLVWFQLGIPGLTASAIYADGRKRIDDLTGSPLPNRNETNVRVDYAIGKGTFLEGLVATFRYSRLRQDGSPQDVPPAPGNEAKDSTPPAAGARL